MKLKKGNKLPGVSGTMYICCRFNNFAFLGRQSAHDKRQWTFAVSANVPSLLIRMSGARDTTDMASAAVSDTACSALYGTVPALSQHR
jgi:hypothetical protein